MAFTSDGCGRPKAGSHQQRQVLEVKEEIHNMHWSMMRRLTMPTTLAACAVTGILALGAIPAHAATVSSSLTLSCNNSSQFIKSGVTVTQGNTGDFKIKQTGSSPAEATKVWARDTQGNTLSTKTVSNGETATWTSVTPSRYTVRAIIAASQNCNGSGFGNGNYTWDYQVLYTA